MAYTPYKSLGTIQGKKNDQYEIQLAKAKRLTCALACSGVSGTCTLIHLNAVFISSIAYPLCLCHLTNMQFHNIQKKYIPVVLNKTEFPRTYAHAIVFCPSSHGGIDNIDFRIEQSIMIIYEVMKTIHTPGHGQDILQIFFRTFQHASSLSSPLLEYPDQRASHLEGHYYVSLRKLLAEHKIQLEFACVKCPNTERKNDHLIMDQACKTTKAKLDDASIKIIYYCRNYLQAHHISNICTADGGYILESVFQGVRLSTQSASRLEEIVQEQRENKHCSVWRKFLRPLCFTGSNKLRQSLRDWTVTLKTSHRLWPFYYSCETNMLYQGYRKHWHDHEDYQFDSYECYNNKVFYFTPEDRNIALQYIPDDTVPADIAVAS